LLTGGGSEGGEVVFEGLVSDLLRFNKSKTGQYLSEYLS
jgi:Excinuclease ATPase subunit